MSHREHGSYVKYVQDGCRCEPCRHAKLAYERGRRGRVAPPYVSASAAREHVVELAAAGVGLKTVAKVSGVSHGALWKLMYGKNGRPSKRIRHSTEQKILAVTPADAAGGAKVNAGPSWLLLDEMIAAGVPRARIAEQLGQKGPGLQLSHNTITARNARAIVDLHHRWKAGHVELARHDRWGNVQPVTAPEAPATRGGADISDLLLDLAEIVEARQARTWRTSAACRGRPSRLWFPTRGDGETGEAGLKICAACTVRDECRAENIDRREGTYGGLTAAARRKQRALEVTAA